MLINELPVQATLNFPKDTKELFLKNKRPWMCLFPKQNIYFFFQTESHERYWEYHGKRIQFLATKMKLSHRQYVWIREA